MIATASTGGGTGYWEVDTNGDVYASGSALYEGGANCQNPPSCTEHIVLTAPVIGIAGLQNGTGYWELASNGSVYPFGSAAPYGGVVGDTSASVGITALAGGNGYWVVDSVGAVDSFGSAVYYCGANASCGHASYGVTDMRGIVGTSDNGGYWLVGADGGVFAFGDAPFEGSIGGGLTSNVVGIAATLDSQGYWLVGSDASIYHFGDAAYLGSVQGDVPTNNVIGIATP